MTIDALPPAFVARMRALLGPEADAFFGAYAESARSGLRVNTAKLSPAELVEATGWSLAPLPWAEAGFLIADELRPGRHPFHAAGLYYLQEPSAMAVVGALDVQPGDHVLDLAAAPGGKSTHLLDHLAGTGLLVANEIVASRIKPLGENLERWGAVNAVIVNDDPATLAAVYGPRFDRVLLDAPCSGEGMFRKTPLAAREWSPEHVAGSANRQAAILREAARLVRPGGHLVYSTCTFAPEENERQIAAFVDAHPGWTLAPISRSVGMSPGVRSWTESPDLPLDHAVRIWPHTAPGEGHFIAKLRAPDAEVRWAPPAPHRRDTGRPPRGPQLDAAVISAWRAFAIESMRGGPIVESASDSARLLVRGDHLFLSASAGLPEEGLRVVRPGLPLGVAKPGRFEPSHALALAMRAVDAAQTIDLDMTSAERYLAGETISASGESGWVLVTVAGWPLGWGRRSGGIVKNHYPRGLRRPVR